MIKMLVFGDIIYIRKRTIVFNVKVAKSHRDFVYKSLEYIK